MTFDAVSDTSYANVTVDALAPAHRRQLEHDSAILPDVLADEDVRSESSSLELPTPDAALRHPNTHKGEHFGTYGETDAHHRPIDLGPGIYFGTRDALGRRAGQYRPDRPRTSYNGHTIKYEMGRGTRPSFAVPRRCARQLVDSLCELFVTEGFKKAMALASAGACAISLNGVDAWSVKPAPNEPSEPIDDFDAVRWHGRIVWIAYDSDAAEKDGVKWAERRLQRELSSRGAVVVVLRIPHRADGSKRGVDDYLADRLAAGVSRADALAELKAPALAELLARARRRPDPPIGSDGGETCRSCAAMADAEATHRAENQLLTRGPVPAQEAVALVHIVRRSALARANGGSTAKLYIPEEAEAANVSKATFTRVLNKLRSAEQHTLPLVVADDWRGSKRHVSVQIPATINSEPWSERAALLGLARARLPEQRKKHGGSQAAIDARWRCRHHPSGPVVEITTTYYRCGVDDCDESHSPPPSSVRHPGDDDRIQLESGGGVSTVELYGAPFAELVALDRRQDDVVNPGEEHRQDDAGEHADRRIQLESGGTAPLIAVSFTSRDEQLAAAGPRYQGDAPPSEPPERVPWDERPIAPRSHVVRGLLPPKPPEPCVCRGCFEPRAPGDPLLCREHRAAWDAIPSSTP